jgi:hypothetical protein
LHLKHHDGRKEARQAQGSNETLAILESPSKCLPSDPSKVAFRSTPEVLELRNLSLSSNTNELVRRTTRTAMPNMTRATFFDQHRVSEECTETVCASKDEHLDNIPDTDSVTSVLECLMEEITALPSDLCGGEVETTIPLKLDSSRHSRFATRVLEKTRLATAAYLDGTQNGSFIQEYQRDPTSLQGRFIGGKTHLTLEISSVPCGENRESLGGPLTRLLSHSHQHRGDLLNSSDIQNLSVQQPGILVESNSNLSFDVIPVGLDSSPSGVILQPQPNCPGSLMLGESRSSHEHLPRVQSETPTKVKKIAKSSVQDVTSTGATSTAPHVSATFIGSVSVKDKIRRLEERVRAAAPV